MLTSLTGTIMASPYRQRPMQVRFMHHVLIHSLSTHCGWGLSKTVGTSVDQTDTLSLLLERMWLY